MLAAPTSLIILGCHRSGTSALAGALALMGWELPKALVAAGRGNPLGPFEPLAVTRLNERLLEDLERSWFDPKPLPDRWLQANASVRAAGEAAIILGEDFGQGPLLIKDPRLSLLLALWLPALAQHHVAPAAVIACRNPYEVAKSLRKRNGFTVPHGLALWQSYMLEAERQSRGLKRIVVHYEHVLDGQVEVLASIAQLAGASGQDMAAAAAFIDRRNHHARASAEEFFANPKVAADIKDTYRAFLAPDILNKTAVLNDLRDQWVEKWQRLSAGDGPSQVALKRPETMFTRSLRAAAADDFTTALGSARAAAELAPESGPFQLHYGKLLLRDEAFAAAAAAFTSARELCPPESQAGYLLITALRAANLLDEALAEVRRALRDDAPGAQYLFLAAHVLADAKAYDEAIVCAVRGMGLAGPSAEASMLLASVLRRADYVAEAAGHAGEALRLAEGQPEVQQRAALMLAKCGVPPPLP